MENFTAIRNGIREHIRDGKLNPFDLGVYVGLHLWADWATGIYHGCALTIAFQFGDPSQKTHIQQSLHRLRNRGYINYRKGNGNRGGYPILIDKYEPTAGKLSGTRLDAWENGDLLQAEYRPLNGRETVATPSCKRDATVATPIQDVQTLDIKTANKSSPEAKDARAVPDFLKIWNENCGCLPHLREITKSRFGKLKARCERNATFERDFIESVKKAAQTPFLRGENDRGWKASFDWFVANDTNHIAVLEGKYDGKRTENANKRGAFTDAGDSSRYEKGADFTVRVD